MSYGVGTRVGVSAAIAALLSLSSGAGSAAPVPPVTTAGPSISSGPTVTTVSVTQTVNIASTGYYIIQLAASGAPSVATLIATGTSFAMTAATPAVVNITGLTAGTNYTYYFVAVSAGGVAQAAAQTVAVTTITAYATWNPSDKDANLALSNGNLTGTSTIVTAYAGARATLSKSTGKWYFEHTLNTNTSTFSVIGIGKAAAPLNAYIGSDANGVGYHANGNIYFNGAVAIAASTYTAGDVIGVAFDAATGNVTWYKNNVSQGTTTTSPAAGPYYPMVMLYGLPGDVSTAKFGATAFTYTPPSGYNAGVYV